MGETADTLRGYNLDDSADSASGYDGDGDRAVAWTATSNDTDTDADSTVTDETLEIRAEIEQTRSEMSATIDAIQERLNPQNIVEQAKETVREATVGRVENMVSEVKDTARETGNSVLDMIQKNPVPAAAIGLGLGWLLTRGGGDSGNGSNAYPASYNTYPSPEREWDRAADGRWVARYPGSAPERNTYNMPYPPPSSNHSSQGQNPIAQVVDTIRQNPIPAALAGIGLWMLTNRSGGSSGGGNRSASYARDYRGYQGPNPLEQVRDRAGDVAEQAKDTVGSAAEQARNTAGQAVSQVQSTLGQVVSGVGDTAGQVVSGVGDTAGQVVSGVGDTAGQVVSGAQEKVGDLASEAQYRAYQAKNQLQRMMEDNPMMVGLLAVAAGAAVGLALPSTPQEHQLMGQARDTLLDRAQEAAQTTIQKVQDVASAAQDTVRQEVEAQGLTV